MKKISLFAIGILLSSSAYAGQISVAAFSADSGVNHLNTFRTTVVDVINGSIQGSTDGGTTKSNLDTDTVYEINMADDANPRLRDSELLSITYDTTNSQGSFVASGCTPATDSDLTSDISACTAYVNGYRVVKSATPKTYTASKDTYVDLSQTGAYNYSEVTVGAAAPSVAANSARLAKVTTDGTSITTVTDLANRRIPGLIIPAQYRTGAWVSKDSATTITVFPGSFEVNSTMINKTSTTTLTLTTAGDWAGGSSLRAANTYGYVGSDSSGNLKLHTTAPAYDNYGVSTTAGKKRYATWSSTVYRILGWFYMDGAQNVQIASNIKEADASNIAQSSDTSQVAISSSAMTEYQKVFFYSSGGPITIFGTISGDTAGGSTLDSMIARGTSEITDTGSSDQTSGSFSLNTQWLDINRPQGATSYSQKAFNETANASTMKRRVLIVSEN